MQNHNTLMLTLEQHTLVVESKELMKFFITLLDHDGESVFETDRESLLGCFKQVHSMLQEAIGSSEPEVVNHWNNIDAGYYKTPWDNWYFKNGLLWDNDGNHYTSKDVKMSWQSEMIINDKIGSQSNIRTMKDHLYNQEKRFPVTSVTLVINGKKIVFTPNVSS